LANYDEDSSLSNATKPHITDVRREPASFRDDRGFVFWQGNNVRRQINPSGQESYDRLMSSGLYSELVSRGWLLEHQELSDLADGAYKVIAPQPLQFVSYPYEWAFSQLKDAALLTLEIQQLALEHNMTLRDASAYNIQLQAGRLVFIDTLSFDIYQVGQPWQAYRQFCQHFLAPLALASYQHPDMSQLLRLYIDGLPLDLTVKLLPFKARWQPGLFTHLSLQAKYQRRYQSRPQTPARVSSTAMLALLDSLRRTITRLTPPISATAWGNYYDGTNYSKAAFAAKGRLISAYIMKQDYQRVLDLGSNNGHFSRLIMSTGRLVLSADVDPVAVEQNYQAMRQASETGLQPLLVDLTNPSPATGWANQERAGFNQRVRADAVVALALVHHLAIGNNVPLGQIAGYFASLAPNLIIEFVPKTDSQVKRLLATRDDIFSNYHQAGFEAAFGQFYQVVDCQPVPNSKRILYLMKRLEHEPTTP